MAGKRTQTFDAMAIHVSFIFEVVFNKSQRFDEINVYGSSKNAMRFVFFFAVIFSTSTIQNKNRYAIKSVDSGV